MQGAWIAESLPESGALMGITASDIKCVRNFHFSSSWAIEGEETVCWVAGHPHGKTFDKRVTRRNLEGRLHHDRLYGASLENEKLEMCFHWNWLCLWRWSKKEMSSGSRWLFCKQKMKGNREPLWWLRGKKVHLPMWETQVQSPSQEDPLEEDMATCPRILAWRIPWTEEPGGLKSMGLQRVKHNLVTKQQH